MQTVDYECSCGATLSFSDTNGNLFSYYLRDESAGGRRIADWMKAHKVCLGRASGAESVQAAFIATHEDLK